VSEDAPAPAAAPAPRISRTRRVAARLQKPAPTSLNVVAGFGEHIILLGQAFAWLFRRPFRPKLFLEQMEFVGVGSLPIILLVGMFSGAVAALQGVYALQMFQQERWVGLAVGISLAREFAPVFSALMITARAGSGMATELGSMRVSEQIDALTTFAVNPIQYLVTPRIVAALVMVPVMTMAFNVTGLFGGYFIAVVLYNVDFGQAAGLYRFWIDPTDYLMGIIKAAVFGLTLALCACYQGFFVRGGAKEVGMATTRAVVTASVSILILDYFLLQILTIIWPFGGG
jgi:phospholipid/cholesterol/gamma-HCH transport system permease protein